MEQEKKWNVEVISMLRDQIDYLNNEIIHKNTLIEQLIINGNNAINTISSLTPADDDNPILECSDTSAPYAEGLLNNKTNTSINSDDVNANKISDDMRWEEVRNKNRKIKLEQNSEIIEDGFLSENYYTLMVLIFASFANFC